MSYDEFNHSSFDSNDDGRIDNAEASFIEETYYSHSDSSDGDGDFDYWAGGSTSSKRKGRVKDDIDFEKLRKDVERDDARKNLIALGIVLILAVALPDSPGVAIFVGGILLSAKISRVF